MEVEEVLRRRRSPFERSPRRDSVEEWKDLERDTKDFTDSIAF